MTYTSLWNTCAPTGLMDTRRSGIAGTERSNSVLAAGPAARVLSAHCKETVHTSRGSGRCAGTRVVLAGTTGFGKLGE